MPELLTQSTQAVATPTSRIAVIGAGYVGLTAATCLAHLGHRVTCTDVSAARIRRLQAGDLPIVEPGLSELFRHAIEGRRLTFNRDNAIAAAEAEVVFLCLPTPQGGDGRADLNHVCDVAREIGPALTAGTIVVNKSTVPVGTAHLMASCLQRDDVYVVSNPEFLAEGTAVRDFLEPDRIVIGSSSLGAARRIAALYQGIGVEPILTDAASAELTKYAANAFLATKLSFVNSIAAICENVGADVRQVMRGVGADHRIGTAFLSPGPGWGGSCFPKDTVALLRTAEDAGCQFGLLEATVAANDEHITRITDKVTRVMGRDLVGVVAAIWGLTFKAGTDDLRDSPALEIARQLANLGASVQGYDPTASKPIDGIDIRGSARSACAGADVLLILTEWPEFTEFSGTSISEAMSGRLIIDARNLLDAEDLKSSGFRYEGVGIPRSDIEAQPRETIVAVGA